jgi:hypothetical protein
MVILVRVIPFLSPLVDVTKNAQCGACCLVAIVRDARSDEFRRTEYSQPATHANPGVNTRPRGLAFAAVRNEAE